MRNTVIVFVVLFAMLSVTSCGVRKIGDKNSSETAAKTQAAVTESATGKTTEEVSEEESAEVEKTENAFPAGLYNMVSSGEVEAYELVSSFRDDLSGGRDLCVLGGFPSTEATLSGKDMGEIWDFCAAAASLPDGVRPGYLLEFDTPEGICEKLILRPADITDAYWDYIETYIYDDIHQTPGAWYSHLLDDEFTDETIVTSVKITAGEKIGDVSNLKLTIFMYEASDRDNIDKEYARANGYAAEIVPNEGR